MFRLLVMTYAIFYLFFFIFLTVKWKKELLVIQKEQIHPHSS